MPEFVALSDTRRASLSEFKGAKLLSIREYYEKDGQASLTPHLVPDDSAYMVVSVEYLKGSCKEAEGLASMPV